MLRRAQPQLLPSPTAAAEDAAESWQSRDTQHDLLQETHACSPRSDDELLQHLSCLQWPYEQQDEQPSGHSGLQQAAAMAAKSARAEVEALQWELQGGHSGGSSGAATAASSRSSSGRLNVSPGANPFYLLESDDDAHGDSEASAGPGSDDSSSGCAWDDGERVAEAAAALSAGRQAQQQSMAAAGCTSLALEPAVTQLGQRGRAEPVSLHEGESEVSCTPAHRASIGELAGRAVLRLSVDLPGVRRRRHVHWQMAPRRSSSAVQQLQLRAKSFLLDLPLPVPVADGQAETEWLATSERLTITMPLSS